MVIFTIIALLLWAFCVYKAFTVGKTHTKDVENATT